MVTTMSKTLRQTDLSKILVLMGRVPLRFFQDILREVQDLQPIQRQLIDHVIVVCKLIYVNPATSATGERSFATARRIKTWLRSKMLQARFNQLAILNTHNDRFDKLCLVSVANSFVSMNENHERNVGKFTTADLSCLTCCFPYLLLRYMHCSTKFTSAYQLSSFPLVFSLFSL